MERLVKIISVIFLTILVFYYVYPQALDLSGSSFVFLSGLLGLGLYTFHKFPFREVIYVILAMLGMLFVFYTFSEIVNGVSDPYTFSYIRSQVAWFFSAYLVVFFLFKVHKNASFNTLMVYVAAAVLLQSVIAFAMYMDDGIQEFFYSLQMQVDYNEDVINAAEQERLVGYGIAFFGAGAMSGAGLIVMCYLFMKLALKNKLQFILLAVAFVFTFYIGLFMARTTIIGMVVGFMLIGILYFLDVRAKRRQGNIFLVSLVFLFMAGYSFAYVYFPSFTDWAFELFENLFSKGKIETKSSNGLESMFIIPDDLHTLIFGNGIMAFWGSDVGFTRLLFYVGIPGTLVYFTYQMIIIKLGFTKDWSINILSVMMLIFVLALNIKGLIDLNFFGYLIFFYFMFYKYYIYIPKLRYRERIIQQEKRLKLQMESNL